MAKKQNASLITSYQPNYPMWKQKMVVVACMVLRNFIRDHGSEDSDFARFDRDPNFIRTIPERYKYNRYAVIWDGSTSEANAGTMDVFRDDLATTLANAWN
jgi:hypothetical protein